jgi:D-glycero-D-manno-heptose 1,7-bisphosphate phosphatase
VSGRAAVFVDRDGVLNEPVLDPVSGRPESPLATADVILIEGAAAGLRRLSSAGWALIGVSNQPAAAKGALTVNELLDVQRRIVELLAGQGVRFEDFRLCLHHPDGVIPDLSGPCACRKPASGMLTDAADALELDLPASWMVGDTDADVLAGRAAGCRTILVEHPRTAHKRSGSAAPDVTTPDLAAAASAIMAGQEGYIDSGAGQAERQDLR